MRRKNSDSRLRALERAAAAEPDDQDVAQKLAAELRRVGREQDALAVEIRARITAGELNLGVARVVSAFPSGLEDRLPETGVLLAALRSVAAPLSRDEIAQVAPLSLDDVHAPPGFDEGWAIFRAGDPERPSFEVHLQDDQSGVELVRAYRSETGVRRRPEEDDYPDIVSDPVTWWRVRNEASAGSLRHLATLAILLLSESTHEYEAILEGSGSVDWPRAELALVRSAILGEEYDPKYAMPGSIKCSKCGQRGLPSGESCSGCDEPFCGHCEGINHPGNHRCEDDEEDDEEDEEVVENTPRRPGGLDLPVVEFQNVWRIGSRKAPKKRSTGSCEGLGVSVTTYPAHWGKYLAYHRRDLWLLAPKAPRRSGLFLSVLDLSFQQVDELNRRATEAGLILSETRWEARWRQEGLGYEDEDLRDDEPPYDAAIFRTRTKAEEFVATGDSDWEPGSASVVEVVLSVPTEALLSIWNKYFAGSLVGREAEEAAWQVMLERDWPELDGFWWDDALDPSKISAPRGSIFYSRIDRWAWQKTTYEEADEDRRAEENRTNENPPPTVP